MTLILARSPLQSLSLHSTTAAMNRPTTRRRSARLEDHEDAPAAKRSKIGERETNGVGTGRKSAVVKKGGKAAYDENDDGFQFTRRTTRKSAAKTAQPVSAPEPIPEEPAKPAPAPARRKKTSVAPPVAAQIVEKKAEPTTRRRSTRLSADREQLEIQQREREREAQKAPPKRARKSAAAATTGPERKQERRKQTTPAPEPEEKRAVAAINVRTPNQNELHVAKKRDGGGAATKIMLPFADTPVIARNKEMRKASKDGHRRSSTGLRGRRASSLIDSGLSNALPHSEVEVREFYKYIEQSLPEPRRMKQLLTWCGSRALPEKPSGNVKDANAIMAARAIQQELIDDFASKPELSDWFSREDTAPTKTIITKPNPVNERNKTLLQEMEEEVKRLEEEKAAWDALASSSKSKPRPPPAPSQEHLIPLFADIDISLLDPAQASILTALQPPPQPSEPSSSSTTGDDTKPPSSILQPPSTSFTFTFNSPTTLQTHLNTLASSLEPNIDLLADGVHKIEQYRNTAERVADRILGTAATRLEERDKGGKEKVGSEGIGVGDVLRGLAGVLNE